MNHDRQDDRTPATRCATGIMPVAVSPSNAPPPPTPSGVGHVFLAVHRSTSMQVGRHTETPADRREPPRIKFNPLLRVTMHRRVMPPPPAANYSWVRSGRPASRPATPS